MLDVRGPCTHYHQHVVRGLHPWGYLANCTRPESMITSPCCARLMSCTCLPYSLAKTVANHTKLHAHDTGKGQLFNVKANAL
eukprot:241981-Chlamydomonas_euryale.AAC.4